MLTLVLCLLALFIRILSIIAWIYFIIYFFLGLLIIFTPILPIIVAYSIFGMVIYSLVRCIHHLIKPSNPKKRRSYKENLRKEENQALITGHAFEQRIAGEIASLQTPKYILSNLYLPKSGDNTSEVDILMIHQTGIYVFEAKCYSGWIFGKESQKEQTQVIYSPGNRYRRGKTSKFKFYNPIQQNESHIKQIKEVLPEKYKDTPIHSVVIFDDTCVLKNISCSFDKATVIQMSDLLDYLNETMKIPVNELNWDSMNTLFNIFQPYTNVTEDVKQKHIMNIQQQIPH